MDDNALLISVNDAAKALGLGRTLTYKLMAEGSLPFVTVGSVRRIRRADLERIAREGAPRRRELV